MRVGKAKGEGVANSVKYSSERPSFIVPSKMAPAPAPSLTLQEYLGLLSILLLLLSEIIIFLFVKILIPCLLH